MPEATKHPVGSLVRIKADRSGVWSIREVLKGSHADVDGRPRYTLERDPRAQIFSEDELEFVHLRDEAAAWGYYARSVTELEAETPEVRKAFETGYLMGRAANDV